MLTPVNVSWGTDPEAFFSRDGKILGSERFIPEWGSYSGLSKVTRDGVQFELHPTPANTVLRVGKQITALFGILRNICRSTNVELNFDGLVEVTREELDSLSPATRILGCMPSENYYGAKPINVDPVEYRKRSSGGHIHMGLGLPIFNGKDVDERVSLVPLMDIFVGNTAVLLDRDPGAAERRENYGRAGEYRLPKHGLEYRTTSNFWLRDYTLMSFVFGMAHVAVSVAVAAAQGQKVYDELVNAVNIEGVAHAINTNDFAIALDNFRAITPFLQRHLPAVGYPLNPNTLDKFVSFAKGVQKSGIETWFPTEGIVDRWCSHNYEEFDKFLARI